jgi:hypothetical protein
VRAHLDGNCILHLEAIIDNVVQQLESRPVWLDDPTIGDLESAAVASDTKDQIDLDQIEAEADMRLLCTNMRFEIERKSEDRLLTRKIWRAKRAKFNELIEGWENETVKIPTLENIRKLQKLFKLCFGDWYLPYEPPAYLSYLV